MARTKTNPNVDPGYFYCATPDGAFAVQLDTPCEGVTTITWKTGEFPGKSGEMEVPSMTFDEVVKAYAQRERPAHTPVDNGAAGAVEGTET